MIIDAFLLIGGFLVGSIAETFAVISFQIPTEFFDALGWVLSQMSVLDFILPVDTLVQAIITFTTFSAFWYGIHIVMWVYHLIRSGEDTTPNLKSFIKGDRIGLGQ